MLHNVYTFKSTKSIFSFKISEKTQSKVFYNLEKTKSKIFITNRLLKAQNWLSEVQNSQGTKIDFQHAYNWLSGAQKRLPEHDTNSKKVKLTFSFEKATHVDPNRPWSKLQSYIRIPESKSQ